LLLIEKCQFLDENYHRESRRRIDRGTLKANSWRTSCFGDASQSARWIASGFLLDAWFMSHTVTPSNLPTAAVRTIASAPQNVTLIAPTNIAAPPARAARLPKIARNASDHTATMGIR